MNTNMFERLHHLAIGGKREWKHNKRENKQTTKLQDWLDENATKHFKKEMMN